ncbi:MAG: PQQ-binding-like beta-propeller repeat protein [Planctomycetes bacterium]|nr:PQQ-binding-like beta-propeller repeat protein [Planctomycetota bacterium]
MLKVRIRSRGMGLGLGLALASALCLAVPGAWAGQRKKEKEEEAPKPAPTEQPKEETPAETPTETPKGPVHKVKDPYQDPYAGGKPDYLDVANQAKNGRGLWAFTDKEMERSEEKSFYTLSLINIEDRAEALVKKGIEKEQNGEFRDALQQYQQVIEKFPNALFRISEFGIFVPVSQYVQRRILNFPKPDLEFYRQKYNAIARESYEQARRNFSLIGLSEIVDTMLATSYGDRALLELGNAALDTGHFLEALEHFSSIRDYFPFSDVQNKELDLKIAYCHKMLGDKAAPAGTSSGDGGTLTADQIAQLKKVIATARYEKPPFHSQLASAPHIAQDDYNLLTPTDDPIGIKEPVWSFDQPGSRLDFYTFVQPVVTDTSVVYRHKNIVYARSILNGELRWINDLGGRATWQSFQERQYPQEDLLVQDGLVFTCISKGGPSLVALDEVTGQLRWAYGPMVASNEEEARMRFEAAPAGGPRTVYAGYVLDNIEGQTHTDSEYGLIAFDSASGRVRWRQRLCRLQPGKFSGGFAESRRNRIRSFTSPPLYSEGTVYYNTNAGVIAAMDARSGRVKWLMRYPYYPSVHDATRQFGEAEVVQYTRIWARPHSPMFWFNQRPLLVGEDLYVAPVDVNLLMKMNRRSGKVIWSAQKGVNDPKARMHGSGDTSYFMGPITTGELLVVHSGRNKELGSSFTSPTAMLLDSRTGKPVWACDDPIGPEKHPVLNYGIKIDKNWAQGHGLGLSRHNYQVSARPLLTDDDKLYIPAFTYMGYPIFDHVSNLVCVDLKAKKIFDRRRYIAGNILGACNTAIETIAPTVLKGLMDLPHKDARANEDIRITKEISEDSVPVNDQGPFLPFSRVTFKRYGVLFELRISPRDVYMIYDRNAVKQALAKRTDPEAQFAKAELAVADAQLNQAADLLNGCLNTINPEDLDFRAAVNQLLFRVHKRIARSGIRAGNVDKELEHDLGMSRTAGTLAEEIETLFALSEAYERKGDLNAAARCLRSVISTYGHHEYPVPAIFSLNPAQILEAAQGVLGRAKTFVAGSLYKDEFSRSAALFEKGLPLYLSTVSPLPKTLTLRAAELASARLVLLQAKSEEFKKKFESVAGQWLSGRPPEEQMHRLPEFPGTESAQKVLNTLLSANAQKNDEDARRRMWLLGDLARVGRLQVPDANLAQVRAPSAFAEPKPLAMPQQDRSKELEGSEGAMWMVLERQGNHAQSPELLFLGARVKKKLDNKFTLTCIDLAKNETRWETQDIRLKGVGDEPGFEEAFVQGDVVVVHGLYDVLAFGLADGKLRWRYRVPFDFEIKHALASGDELVIFGKAETMALHIPTPNENGELMWQEKEQGDMYIAPYFDGDYLVSVRKLPYNVTVRYRATGKLIGRMEMPDLLMLADHPLIDDGPKELPAAHDGNILFLTDSWYYICIDTRKLAVVWKRLIDNNDVTREPAMRFFCSQEYFCVLKEDYDVDTIYMLSAKSGDVLWSYDPKDGKSPKPMHSAVVVGPNIYGLGVHPGQGYYFVGRECATGKRLFETKVEGYQGKPEATLVPQAYGEYFVVRVKDRQDFEIRVFDKKVGKEIHAIKVKGAGDFGVHGQISSTVQNGRAIMFTKDKNELKY